MPVFSKVQKNIMNNKFCAECFQKIEGRPMFHYETERENDSAPVTKDFCSEQCRDDYKDRDLGLVKVAKSEE